MSKKVNVEAAVLTPLVIAATPVLKAGSATRKYVGRVHRMIKTDLHNKALDRGAEKARKAAIQAEVEAKLG